MSDWKPGDVALVIGENIAEPRVAIKDTHGWAVSNQRGDTTHARWVNESYVTPIRPLVVIDPEDREAVERLHQSILRIYGGQKVTDVVNNTGLMQAALREFANPKPPKPDEPQGLGAVVEDADGYLYIRTHDREDIDFSWSVVDESANKGFRMWKWESIDVVRVLSEGVRP